MDDSEIPIDIHTNKLMDWLISRRHVQKDWQTKVMAIRQKINEAIKDMPVHDGIAALLSGSYINYFHCIKIVKILETTENDSKNIFGQYGSQRMKDWKEIIKMYVKDNTYLGEVASLLLRNVQYEIPALRKQIQKTVQQQNECDRKVVDYEKLANNIKNEIATSFKDLGITGKNIRLELLTKAADLPEMNQIVVKDVKNLAKAVEFYKLIVHKFSNTERQVLKHLQLVIEKGDITIYELKHGTPPSSIEVTKLDFKTLDETVEEDAIDFDVDLNIDADVGDIDWGITTDDGIVETKAMDSSVAQGINARTILSHPESRTSFLNDILELEAFLKLRQYELKKDSDSSLSMMSEELMSVDEKTLNGMLNYTQKVLQGATNPSAIHYLNINTNPNYVDQLAKKLQQRQETLEKLQASKEFVKEQKKEYLTEGATIEPKVQLLIDRTFELQSEIEGDICKKYNGRPVNLMGGVNTLCN